MRESLPLPRRDSEFPEWLAPARRNIQHELSRIKNLLAASPQNNDVDQLNLMLGAAFSLWQAVFHVGHRFDDAEVIAVAQNFVDDVIGNSVSTQHNSWLMGYYVSNARLRLIRATLLWGPEKSGIEFHNEFRRLMNGPSEPKFDPGNWGNCYYVLHYLLLFYESKARRSSAQSNGDAAE
jgi:hypothetical protein